MPVFFQKSQILNNYITSYITKGEKKATEDLWDAIGKANIEKSLASRLYSLASTLLKKREVGMYEIGDVLRDHHLCEFSTREVSQCWDQREEETLSQDHG